MHPTPMPTQSEERTVALITWLVTFVAPIVGPIIAYVLYMQRSKFVAFHALQALFLHIAIVLAAGALGILTAITFGLGAILTIPGYIVLGVISVLVPILYAIKAYNGEQPELMFVGKLARNIVGS